MPTLVLPDHLQRQCEKFAHAPYPVVILGEPGVGKSHLARHIHLLSGRAGGFVERSVAELPDELAAGELFGHADNAFTGARRERAGLVEQAHRGTLFLDEFGLASALLQRMLLRVVEGHPVTRLGETQRRLFDARLIIATNEDLAAAARDGSFRIDLIQRLGRLTIVVPPLRERRSEIRSLAAHFVLSEAPKLGFAVPVGIRADAASLLSSFNWPDNIRGLLNVIRFALLMAHPADQITPEHLPEDVGGGVSARDARRPLAMWTDADLRWLLDQVDGNRTAAARRIGISREHLTRTLNERGIRQAGVIS